MTTGPEVRAVVVHYNTPDLTARCVASLWSEGVSSLVLDNHSPDPAWERLQDLCADQPDVSLVRAAANDGYGAGVNAAIRALGDDYAGYVWVVNPDMLSDPGAAVALVSTLEARTLDIACPAMYSGEEDRRSIYFIGGTLNLRRVEADHWSFGRPYEPGHGVVRCSLISGASFMLSRATWYRLGGMREDLFLYWEDAALSYRAQTLALRVGVVREAAMWHRVGASTSDRGISARTYYYTCRNRFVVSREWGMSLARLLAGTAAGPTYRWPARALLREQTDRAARTAAALRGTAAGVAARMGKRSQVAS